MNNPELTCVDTIIGLLETEKYQLQLENCQLKSGGWISLGEGFDHNVPSVSWKQRRYLIFTWWIGNRRETRYIGCDPFRQREALEGLTRQKRYLSNLSRIGVIDRALTDAEIKLKLVRFTLSQLQSVWMQ